ncbi:chemokine XC receptor 1-like [Lampris incognitus]|uniref:chemokine XC receptor 1-like n=1 Tax=Lampris incognitus TaxID=2546036 RepID=UPI0024B4AF46|nr:chemokine XC receptor 1-like [Lampris incognitus]
MLTTANVLKKTTNNTIADYTTYGYGYESSVSFPIYDYMEEDDYGNELCDKASIVKLGAVLTSVFFSLVVFFCLFGNILVMVILTKYENLKSLPNIFILNLAVSDLIFSAGLPFWAYYHVYGWTLGEAACKIVSFVFYLGFNSSSVLLIVMTIYRYVAVMSPLTSFMSTKGIYSVLASVVIWAGSSVTATPALIFTKVLDQTYCDYKDPYWKSWGIYQQNILFLVTFFVFGFCYSQIVYKLLRPTARRRRDKSLKLIFTLVVFFLVGWAPYNIVIFLKSLSVTQPVVVDSITLSSRCEDSKPLEYAFYISRLVAFSHCCLNPVFYVFVGVKFKNHLKKLLLRRWGQTNSSLRRRSSRYTVTSLTSGGDLYIATTGGEEH